MYSQEWKAETETPDAMRLQSKSVISANDNPRERLIIELQKRVALGNNKWTHWDLNPGPSACEADVIPLHHVPSE